MPLPYARRMRQSYFNENRRKAAQRLTKFCKDKLTKTEAELQKIQVDIDFAG